ncbi:MAG TPA: glycerophosphodiester phosphodiesterase family protein [Candidatus Hydrogenedentes bacterium]|nr:glycerophosphodiester phosphodiesterase family protein [Candidatus Hydrogenedentota bacterium]HQE82078.1 glycerophosphodiester phosphodiesterase family protein [Candidatus Hydrogenedentota bacterium]HQH52400.1 glycerophosphodiester phosphodiesterase family protein [Candidatus Hydrogenedentota bacterium]HQM49100.1 glycerophosphodiester phosphodiesterase family protein [Candidatus Hydrogenedentota bacterium]
MSKQGIRNWRLAAGLALFGMCVQAMAANTPPPSANTDALAHPNARPRGPGKIVIAHRGASGYLPEHTLAAYAMAYALGSDYIEQDLVFTKDGQFICLHDIELDATTNVEEVFPERKRENGKYYAADFTLAEIRQLRVESRMPSRFEPRLDGFRVATFVEAIELIQALNASTGRGVGLYPELKQPAWHREQGLPMEAAFMEIVTRYGYKGPDARIYVQCAEAASLKQMRTELGSKLPQVLLIGGKNPDMPLLQAEGLAEIASYAQGIGPARTLLEQRPEIVSLAHSAGLLVHPYTFFKELVASKYPSFDYELRHYYFVYDVDGLFTDFPDAAYEALCAGKP